MPGQALKADPLIVALIQRVKAGGRPSVDESRFVFGDQAYIRVTLADSSPAAIEQLRKAGLTITRTEGNVLVGQIALTALETLAKLPAVAWIAPR